jgi:hypothetical protein
LMNTPEHEGEWSVRRDHDPQPRHPSAVPIEPDMTFRAFFGDRVRAFHLTAPMIAELERVTGAGFGGLCSRLFRGDFKFAEVSETIRLALIGAGEKPERAAELVAVYVADRPLSETLPIAIGILETRWFDRRADAAPPDDTIAQAASGDMSAAINAATSEAA